MTGAAEIAQLRAQLQAYAAERERWRAAYEALGIGSTDPAFARAVSSYAVAAVWVDNVETELRRLGALAEDRRAA